MPARAPHIPHAIERSALQKLNGPKGLSKEGLYPAGKNTITKMLAKGWIERRPGISGPRYLITPDGAKALKARIPVKEPGEKSASD